LYFKDVMHQIWFRLGLRFRPRCWSTRCFPGSLVLAVLYTFREKNLRAKGGKGKGKKGEEKEEEKRKGKKREKKGTPQFTFLAMPL